VGGGGSMSGMDDRVTWLRAQLDDDERIARAVPDHRQRNGELHWQEISPDSQPGLVGDQCGNVVTLGGPGGTSRWHGEHIARHDPARVLAEVDAKRRILDEVADEATGLDMQVDGEFRVGSRDEKAEPYLGDKLVRLLALPYADRPGYRHEWKP